MKRFEWMCPRCGATPGKHGKGGVEKCAGGGGGGSSRCEGFICEADGDPDTKDHGTTLADRCTNAVCYHCDWYGEFPRLPNEWKKGSWQWTAWRAGWRPKE